MDSFIKENPIQNILNSFYQSAAERSLKAAALTDGKLMHLLAKPDLRLCRI